MKCIFPSCVTYESSLEILFEAFAYLPAAMNRLRAIDEDDDDGDNGERRWQRDGASSFDVELFRVN